MQIFLNESDASYFYYEGAAAGELSNRRVRLREVKADLIGHTNELLAKAIDQRQLDSAADRRGHAAVRQLPRQPGVPRHVRSPVQGVREPPAPAIRTASRSCSAPASATGCDPFPRATAPPRRRCSTRSAGMDQIPKAFQRAIGGNRITFNAEVQSVHQPDRTSR